MYAIFTWAMNSPAAVREFFGTVLQQACHFKVDVPFEKKLHIDYSTRNHPTQLHAVNDIDCCFMATLSLGKPARLRIMRKRWSHLLRGLSMNLREQKA